MSTKKEKKSEVEENPAGESVEIQRLGATADAHKER